MLQEIILIIILLVILTPFASPEALYMPQAMAMTLDVALVVVFVLVAVFLWRERARDEREQAHRMFADRIGFLVGSGALVIVIVVQSYLHRLDPYAPLVLLLMVLAKIIARIWARNRS